MLDDGVLRKPTLTCLLNIQQTLSRVESVLLQSMPPPSKSVAKTAQSSNTTL